MNAYVSKKELALLPANQPGYPEHHAEQRNRNGLPRHGLFTWIAAWLERRRAFSQLSGLTDRELQDIGLIRADIGRVFEPGFASSRS